jgi:hypothetical protein
MPSVGEARGDEANPGEAGPRSTTTSDPRRVKSGDLLLVTTPPADRPPRSGVPQPKVKRHFRIDRVISAEPFRFEAWSSRLREVPGRTPKTQPDDQPYPHSSA